MRRLYLLRHAEASAPVMHAADHDRDLTARGRMQCDALAVYVQENGMTPDMVLVSSARRTVETAQRVFGAAALTVEKDLYVCGEQTLLRRIRAVENTAQAVAVVAHNPDIHALTYHLGGTSALVPTSYPPASFSVFDVNVAQWADVGPDTVQLGEVRLG